MTIAFLSHPMSSFLADHEPAPLDDFKDISDYQNLLQGYWYDGEPITFGGKGYQSGGPETKYMFTGRPSVPGSWTAFDQLFSSGLDFMLGVSNLGDLPPDQVVQVDHAYTLHDLPLLGPAESVDSALSQCHAIQQFYDNGFSIVGGNPIPCLTDCVWPGDMDANGICNNLDILEWGISVDRTGPARSQPFAGWLPQHGLQWGPTGGLAADARHQDGNGDGQVDEQDIYVVRQNFGKANSDNIAWGGHTVPGNEMQWTRLYNGLTSPNEHLMPGQKFMLRLDVSEWPVDSIYSLGYSVSWDTTVVSLEPGFNQIPKSSPFVDSSEVFYPSEDGMIHIGITRTNHMNQPFVPFELGKMLFRIKPDAQQEQFPDATLVRISNVKAYLADGTELTVGSAPISIPYGLVTGLEEDKGTTDGFLISPNPTRDMIDWKAAVPITSITLHAMDGTLVSQWHLGETTTSGRIHVDLLSGCYVLTGLGINGTIYRMKVIKY